MGELVEKVDRARFLRLGAVSAAGAAGAGLLGAGPAGAALPAPDPQGDDVGFLSFAVVAEGTSQRAYQEALHVRGLVRGGPQAHERCRRREGRAHPPHQRRAA